ncbi:4-hydroxy-tetrahydrodipicolinate synthase [Ferrovibrio sp.]|uniref:4-hydroxy-tetrahydrodipicolinate synthase n=1 Tax=Ferrovibrio sp. TaxID=1917215 RepID=UPI001B5EB769|nr:4-hydroxy-tetrahydrodipicolinate synthase [Ferrovibrio sp.]MBP7064250.1 4-hydroxy-tetrahydrodipicolinate synthase [Ferrovibrio sp.]
MFKGSFVALITPFKNGKVDERAFGDLVEWQIAEGTHGLVPCGTTGESPTLSHDEHKRVVELCIEVARGRVPVMAGAGSNSTAEAIELTKHAKKAGADAVLVVTPYYNKPNQAGLFAHYKALHDATRIPIFIYNIPPRCVIDMSVETMAALAKLPRIAGVKDATGDILRPLRMRAAAGEAFCQLDGDDATALAFNAHGGVGCISVTANIAPGPVAQMQEASLAGDHAKALAIMEKLLPLHTTLFVEPNPAPVKYAASLLGICQADVRLPLVGVSKDTQAKVKAALKAAGLAKPRKTKKK